MPGMSHVYEVVEARRHMCGKLARQLRLEHQTAAMRVGVDVHRGLREVYDRSFYRRAWRIDGTLAALGGATGTLMSPSAFVWLALTEQATRHRFELVREARRQMAHIMRARVQIETTVICGDEAAKRLLVFLGWHVTDSGEGAAAETRYGRRRLTDFIDHEESIRIPLGEGAAIRMGYHAPYESAGNV